MTLCRRFIVVVAATATLLAAAPVAAQSNNFGGKNRVRYDEFEWRVYSTPHFRISYYDRVEPSLPKIASFAESAYDELARRLDFQVEEPIPLLAYANHAEFEQTNVISNFIPEGVGAFATPSRNRMVLPVDLPDRELQALIQHELTHIFQYEIFFQGRLGRALYSQPPLWFMEGMASYLGRDETSRDTAYMRDAVLSDIVPSVAQPVGGFFAYRFGHMVFEFVEDEWGEIGMRDFVFEMRNALGGNILRAIDRAFDMDVEEFDSKFRAWLRTYYLDYAERGTPREFGPRFRIQNVRSSTPETSPIASPSGDLVAAFATHEADVDVVLFGVPDRRLFKNLTSGLTQRYRYLDAQGLTIAPARGRDLAFSPDGNHIAVFARKERGRLLLLLDAVHGGIDRMITMPRGYERPGQPAYSPDGSTIAFHAFAGQRSDLFLLDLESEEITNLTNDDTYDSSPVFAPDGRHLVYTAEGANRAKLVQISLENPSERKQLTFGSGSDEGAAFSRDGNAIYFTSDRDQEIYDIYRLDLETRNLTKLTNVIGSALNPTTVSTDEGERVVYQGYYRGSWSLYLVNPKEGTLVGEEKPPTTDVDLEPFTPAVTVAFDEGRSEDVKRRKLFIDNVQALVGINNGSDFVSQSYISLSDQYGDRRVVAYLESVAGYQNIQLSWFNLEKRLQWGVTLFDDRAFFYEDYNTVEGEARGRRQIYRQTGAAITGIYPLSTYLRLQGSGGYLRRDADLPFYDQDRNLRFRQFQDNVPFAEAGIVGDTTIYRSYGPHAGRRWELNLGYYYDGEEGGALSRQVEFEARQYIPLTRRNELAIRLYAAAADGNRPNVFYFGGLDTMRGFGYRTISGNRAGYLNVEWRLPLIDELRLPWLRLTDVRGHFFVDVGAAWFEQDGFDNDFTFMDDGRLVDGFSAYGFGISLRLLGLPVHWEFAKRWDFEETLSDFETDFWIGFRF